MTKDKILFLAGALFLAGCASQQGNHPVAREIVRPGTPHGAIRASTEPEFFRIPDEDIEMARAVRKARRTVGKFIAAVQNPTAGQRDFEVKKPFVQGAEVEHIWLSNVTFHGNRFHGYVDNHPRKIKGLKLGDRVSVNPDEISDWAFVDHGRLVGGYSIRVLYKNLSPERQKELEQEANFHIH